MKCAEGDILIIGWRDRRLVLRGTGFGASGRSGTPPVLLVVAVAAWLGSAALWPSPRGVTAFVLVLCGLGVCLAAMRILVRYSRVSSIEQHMWRPVVFAGLAIAGGFALQALLAGPLSGVRGSVRQWLELTAGLPQLFACAFLYRGLVLWNRFRTAISDPADWLNGVSASLAMAAIGHLLVRWADPHSPFSGAQQQLWLVTACATAVALGTLGTVSSLADLGHDRRVWYLAGALSSALGGQVADLAAGESPVSLGSWSQSGWLVALALIALATREAPKLARSRPSTTGATTAGTLVVLVASVAILAVGALTSLEHKTAAVYAVVAFVGASVRGVHIVRDLAHLAQSRVEARTDELTGMANRRELMARLDAGEQRGDRPALLLIDLNRFKEVNDRYGHAVGDELLIRISRRLARHAPAGAVLARLGGDEFAMLLPDGAAVTDTLTQRLVTAVRAPVTVEGYALHVGVSMGLADAAAGCLAGSELLRRADVAMYDAKRQGLAYSAYSGELERAIRSRAERADQIRQVLTNAAGHRAGELVVLYQAQVDARDGRTTGAEALVRWSHPVEGVIGPDQFLPLVEEQGLMGELTDHVLGVAIAQARHWRASGQQVAVAVNVSASSLADRQLPERIGRMLIAEQLPPHLLTIEITETAVMSDPERAIAAVERIRRMGVGVSIDDYGTGYSSLAYLNTLAANELKIDRSLIAQVIDNARTATIVAGTIELAHGLGLRVVAEGIEERRVQEALQRLGCDVLQGYLFGRPVAAEDFTVPARVTVPHPLRPVQPGAGIR